MPMTPSAFWLRILLGTACLYALMASVANWLGSTRGESGGLVGALILCAALVIDRFAFAPSFATSWRALGLGAPRLGGMGVAALICAALIVTLPLTAAALGISIAVRSDWLWLVPGLLAQAGLAEEIVFRGFLYGRIRATRPFWRSVLFSIGPFALVHLAMFFTLPWPIATASLALAVLTCAPLAQLYELAGRTIWAPALLHATIQGAIKLIDFEGATLPLIWIAACALLPYAAFAWRRPMSADRSQQEPE